MRKLLSLLFLMSVLVCSAQKSMPNSDPLNPKIIYGPLYRSLWGSVNDTLVASDTMEYIMRLEIPGMMQMMFYPYVHKVSGTVTNKIIWYGSGFQYPYHWIKVDSIVNTGVSTGYLTPKQLTNWMHPYMKISIESGATTQKADYEIPFIFEY